MTTEIKPTSSKTTAISIKLSDSKIIESFNELKPDDKSNPEFIAELLECYKVMTGKSFSEISDEKLLKNMLTVSQDDKKSTDEEKQKKRAKKEENLRKLFELQPNDPLSVTERHIIEAATKVSNKKLLDMFKDGALLIAKQEIGKFASVGGNEGKADERLKQTYELMKQLEQKVTINRLATVVGTNRKTVEDWAKREQIILDK